MAILQWAVVHHLLAKFIQLKSSAVLFLAIQSQYDCIKMYNNIISIAEFYESLIFKATTPWRKPKTFSWKKYFTNEFFQIPTNKKTSGTVTIGLKLLENNRKRYGVFVKWFYLLEIELQNKKLKRSGGVIRRPPILTFFFHKMCYYDVTSPRHFDSNV